MQTHQDNSEGEHPLTPKDKIDRQLEFLRADLQALKTEIVRRSDLQRYALAAYLVLVSSLTGIVVNGMRLALPVTGLWSGSFLILLFWCRENLEIIRLAGIIQQRIAGLASSILQVPPEALIPSETAGANPQTDVTTRRYHRLFMWVLFIVLPAFITLYAFSLRTQPLTTLWAPTPTLYCAFLSLVLFLVNVKLLRKNVDGQQGWL